MDSLELQLRERKTFTISRSEYSEAKNILALKTYPNITLHHCLKPIPVPVIQNLKCVLTSLTLSSLTSFSNIVSCIQNLHALRILTFKKILIDKKYSLPLKPRMIKVGNLRQLHFEHQVEEPNNDIFLLDFFSSNISFSNLLNFSFLEKDDKMSVGEIKVPTEPEFKALFKTAKTPEQNAMIDPNSPSSSFMETLLDPEDQPPTTESLTLTRFLTSNVRRLRALKITDHSVRIGSFLPDNLANLTLALLRLRKYTYSLCDPGQQYILSCQRKLEQLGGTGFIFDYHPEDIERFFGGVCKNYKTLTSIRISPNIVFSEIKRFESMDELLSSVSIDCEVFLQCPLLLTLHIDLNVVERQPCGQNTDGFNKRIGEQNIRKIGLIHNLHTLPDQLQNITIFGNFLHQDEVELLISRLPSFRFLNSLTLGISYSDEPEDCFTPTLEWAQVFLHMSILVFNLAKFVGCNDIDNIPHFSKIQTYANESGILIEKQMIGNSHVMAFMF